MDSIEFLSRYRPDLDGELRSTVGGSSLPLYGMMRYHLGWEDGEGRPVSSKGGKLLRPGLCLLACEAVGGDWRSALPAAVSLELVHNFTLIHDDIEDQDRQRRGKPTLWTVWGEPQAINAGDAMHVMARLALLRLADRQTPVSKVLQAARLLDETCLKLCEGQCMDISFEGRTDVGIDEYLDMIERKTAALFGCSVEIGASLGTDHLDVIRRLADFGRELGLAFQIQDDLLGIWGEDLVTGKSASSDIVTKKKTLPIVYAFQQVDGPARDRLGEAYRQDRIAEGTVSEVMEILEAAGAREYAEGIAEHHFRRALDQLEDSSIPASYKARFRSLAEFVIGREY